MIWDKTEHPISRWATFSVEHLVEIGNLELATLKVHLVIEDALRYLLAARLKVQDHQISSVHLDFASLAELALVAIADPHLVGAVRALNAARNSLSHHVDSPQLHAKLTVFCQEIAYLDGSKVTWPSTTSEQLFLLKDAFDRAAVEIFNIAMQQEETGGKRGGA